MNKIKQIIAALVLSVGIGFMLAPAVSAVDVIGDVCKDNTSESSAICRNQGDNVDKIIGTVVNTLLFILGAVSVVVIIIGGIMYTVSAGDSGAINKAKNTILYAVIGLVVAFLAYAIVNWVFNVFA